MRHTASRCANLIVETVDTAPSVHSAVVSFCRRNRPAILESSLPDMPYSRFTILASDPADVATFFVADGAWVGPALKSRMQSYPNIRKTPGGPAFAAGWIGYFGYEAGLQIEGIATRRLSQPEPTFPLARFCLYDASAVYDHRDDQWYISAVDWPSETRIAAQRPSAQSRLQTLRQCLNGAADHLDDATRLPRGTNEPTLNMSYESYLSKVDQAKSYIAAGDIYQVNLTQRFTAETKLDPGAIYRRLRRLSPSSHAAFLQWNEARPMAVISSSPELFLDLRDGHVVTRPIKGTRPRVGDPTLDAAYREELVESEKDRAELNMIIDLLRNDLGRVCRFGSVRVLASDQIEDHPTVFHRVATIEGDLDPRFDWLDLLEATFPGGSITGTPKIRAMQIIDELEPTPRSVYCGAIGYIGLDGNMSLNVAIRTMTQHGGTVHIHAGGAIVADSRPADEYDELMAKASAMLRAVGCQDAARVVPTTGVTCP